MDDEEKPLVILDYKTPDDDRLPGASYPVRIAAGLAAILFLLIVIGLLTQEDALPSTLVSLSGSIYMALIACGYAGTRDK